VPKIVIYTKPFCPYCERAKSLFDRKGAPYEEIIASMDPEKRNEMREKSGRTTYPQIFIDDAHIGGCDELMALDREGGLDPLLAA
jgi:glutaredoxin 3